MDANAYQNYGVQPMTFDIKPKIEPQEYSEPLVENNSIRAKPLDPEYIDSYMQKNRHRVSIWENGKLFAKPFKAK